ncbi:MAG: glucose-6-phosphate isomerase [Thermogutta sp.]
MDPRDTKSLTLRYDSTGVEVSSGSSAIERESGVLAEDLQWLWPRLLACRDEVLAEVELKKRGETPPPEKNPLDCRFIDLPERLLGSERTYLERIRSVCDRFAKGLERVVVLGIGGSYMGARALFEACCHPYHNELSRSQRGDRPRLYFEGNNVDNDAVYGLLELLHSDPAADWGIVVISKSGSTLETAVAFRVFVEALREYCRSRGVNVGDRILAVSQEDSRLWRLCRQLGVPKDQMFAFPEDVGGRFSVLSAVGLVPAAILGLDIEALLRGACAANDAFRSDEPEKNPMLRYVAICHLMEVRRGASIRVLSTWGKRLEAVGLWYDQLLAESLGKNGQGATPLTVVNTRDLHSRGQQHQEGRRDKLFTNLWVQQPSLSTVTIPRWECDDDQLNKLAGKSLADILDAARQGTTRAYAEDFRRSAEIVLPRLNERSLGELFQFLMLVTVVEGRLIGINPYGQPGVEAYKRHMQQLLSRS